MFTSTYVPNGESLQSVSGLTVSALVGEKERKNMGFHFCHLYTLKNDEPCASSET